MSKPLLQRNTNALLLWLPIVLVLSSGIFYIMLLKHALHAQEKYLILKQQNVWNKFVLTSGTLEKHISGEYDITDTVLTTNVPLNIPRDTSLFYSDKKTNLPFQVLTSKFQWNEKTYFVSTYISSTETAHLIVKVFAIEGVILLLLLMAVVVITRKSSGKLWSPFFSTITAVEKFDIVRNKQLQLSESTGTTEFDRLNTVLNKLVEHANTAYFNQKQFVENASHETQTPLAIIRAKLELLINQPDITEKQASLLGDVANATNRLSEMNKTLLLLAKIENNQFPDIEAVNVSDIVREVLDDCVVYYNEGPEIKCFIEEEIVVNANRSLIEILISNIINNAIVHNNDERKLTVTIRHQKLKIENTGDPLQVSTDELFERFKKNSHTKRSTGLGLALVKQISQLYKYNVVYDYNDGWHSVDVSFK